MLSSLLTKYVMIAPMVTSMTAFSRQSSQKDWGVLIWELRSVNHRFFDLSMRLPDSLRALEPVVREKLSKKLHRGKVEAFLKLTPTNHNVVHINFNEAIVQKLADAGDMVLKYFPNAQTDVLAILAWPGVIETEIVHHETANAEVLELLQQCIDDLVEMRRREGEKIKAFIQQRLNVILELIAKVSEQIPQLLAAERERIQMRIVELSSDIDLQRLEQEMLVLIQKTDVSEEIQRLASHCQAMALALSQTGAMGRRLDFLSQELNREANTLSSKALGITLTQASIEMKVLIEQIREQVQNIE